jgi:hypothetical protein
MTTPNIKYSPLRGVYVDSKGRVVKEKTKVSSLATLDKISAVILVCLGLTAFYFMQTHTIHFNTNDNITFLAITPKDNISYSFEIDKADLNKQVVHLVKATTK